MKLRRIYGVVTAFALSAAFGCKGKPSADDSSGAPSDSAKLTRSARMDQVIQSKDEVCRLLTRAEVSAQLKKPIQLARQRAIVLDAPTECIYPTTDEPGAGGVAVRLSFQREGVDGTAGFARAVLEACGHDQPRRVPSLGDEAVQCGKLLVRKRDSFFVLSSLEAEPTAPWAEVAQHLARTAVSRLP